MEVGPVKVCSKCKAEKPLTDFARNYGSKDGYQSWCKSCLYPVCNANNARRRAANKARHLAAEAERKGRDD